MVTYGVMMGITVIMYILLSSFFNMEKTTRITVTIFFVLYIALLCLRDITVGVDTKHYVSRYFDQLCDMRWDSALQHMDTEKGFLILTKLIGYIGGERLFIAVIAVISVYPVLYLYKNEAKDALLCCSFFLISLLFEIFFSGMRQGVAIGLAVPAFYFVKRKKLIPFIAIVALAMCFHTTGIVIALIYPIYHVNITRKWLWFIVPGMVLIYLRRSVIFKYMLQKAGGYYLENYGYLTTESSGQTGLMILFVLISIYTFIILDEKKATKEDIGVRNILLLATAIQLLTPVHPVISRLNYYFILFIPIAIGRVNEKCKPIFWQVSKVASTIMSIFFVFYFFAIKDDSLQVFNYKFFF